MPQTILRNKREFKLNFSKRTFDLSSRTHLMGILNVTPDSFSDGGEFFQVEDAVKQGVRMAEEGADIIDVGGESTRPESDPVTIEEELSRVIPVIEALSKEIDIPISIDTYKSQVAKKALDAGAEMINHISALRFDPQMKKIAAEYQVPIVLMHIKGTPKNMQENPYYDDVIEEIIEYLRESMRLAIDTGIQKENIIIDPGIGFGKRLEDNLNILKNLKKFSILDCPILVGPSRKSFIGKILTLPVEERLEGSLAALAVSIMNGANIVRVHDVKESKRVACLVDTILNVD
ncbi:MAG: dihydropteroate synthase [candidate division Zixibacteria bacterium SM23_73]|nr:MAG: dihydropteroate synthase [candidate division Zixibacteria bacterium SM23_73]